MSELRIPLDVEQLAETCQLRTALRSLRTANPAMAANPREIEQAALFLILRLFITLGYLARSTNRPGVLTFGGALQLRESLQPLYGDDCDPVKLLQDVGFIVPLADGQQNGAWHCELFAKLNGHLAGDYRPGHMKGNEGRQVTLAVQAGMASAPHQALLLLPEACQRTLPDGSRVPFEPQELDRLMVVIGAIDKIFKFTRQRTQFTESLLNAAAKACAVCGYNSTAVAPEFRQFLGWLISHRDSPRVPKTTDQLLADFETLYRLAGS